MVIYIVIDLCSRSPNAIAGADPCCSIDDIIDDESSDDDESSADDESDSDSSSDDDSEKKKPSGQLPLAKQYKDANLIKAGKALCSDDDNDFPVLYDRLVCITCFVISRVVIIVLVYIV